MSKVRIKLTKGTWDKTIGLPPLMTYRLMELFSEQLKSRTKVITDLSSIISVWQVRG